MGKFSGMLICTDLDGTLLKNDKSISKENIDAIEYFKSEGGYFTFITGRMPSFVLDFYNLLKPNTYVGCANGSALYDFENKKYVWTAKMKDGAKELTRLIDKKFPKVGIQVNTYYKVYFSKDNQTMKYFRKVTNAENLKMHYDDVCEPLAKVIFGTDDEVEIKEIEKTLTNHPLAKNFGFIRSEKSLFEILPKGIGKGSTLKKLAEMLDIKNTVAIGDYNNDISMFETAKIGVAVSNACDDAKAKADFITVSNEENAVAKVIFDLEKEKLKFL